jgi:hypothetical protein
VTASDKTAFNLIVTGDLVVDHHIYEGERHWPAQERARGLKAWRELGGADLTRKLLAETFKTERTKAAKEISDVEAAATKEGVAIPKDKGWPEAVLASEWQVALGIKAPDLNALVQDGHAMALWKPFPENKDPKKSVWRVGEPLGYGEASGSATLSLVDGLARPSILVLDEAGYRFRGAENKACWLLPELGQPEPDWIVLKMARPLTQGDLWHALTSRFSDKLVCVISADDLRQECVSVSHGLGWERTIEEVCAAVLENPVLKGLSQCRHLIVRFKCDGALWIRRDKTGAPDVTLIFDAAGAEGMWDDRFEGRVIGYSSVMTVAIAHALAKSVAAKGAELDLVSAIKAGLAAGRDLLQNGHGPVGERAPEGFPAPRLADMLTTPTDAFASMKLPTPQEGKLVHLSSDRWSLIELSQRPSGSHAKSALIGLAHEYVLKGEDAIKRLPYARFGVMTTIDRTEIEALRGIRCQMLEYRDRKVAKKPLSIGVFGPPGAGKSFGVKQLAKEVFKPGAWMEFNLSQFDGPEDLIGALHQVRDKVLDGITPVVFWDEFDSQKFKWLQYLLAPMQDGAFQEGQITHAVGKCVFIFAGGTCATFKLFGDRAEQGDEEDKADFRLKKGPDFHSRLDAYYNVLGPNPRDLEGKKGEPDPSDISYPLRRALLIRALLGCGDKDRLDFDSDLIDVLLMVPRYKHGARSLEKLVSSLKQANGGPIRRSGLPSAAQIDMHVDAAEFAKLLDSNATFRMSEVIETLATSIHNNYRAASKAANQKIEAQYDMPFAELAPIDKEDNRAAARRIPEVLALAGLGIANNGTVTADASSLAAEIDAHVERHMERLAEAEHDGWMDQRKKNNWSYGNVRVNAKKIHNLLVPYAQLPEDQKKKDRDAVKNYHQQITDAGYRLDWL